MCSLNAPSWLRVPVARTWQGWSGWRSHGREHTTGQPGQPWHDEAWRRDRASQGSTQERGPVGDTGGAHSARAFPSQGKGTPSVHRQDRSLEKAYRKNAEARAKRDPEAKRVSRSSFLRNRQRAPKSRRLGKGQGKASRADPPNQSLVRPPGVRSPPPARQKADARAKQELGSAASSSHRGKAAATEATGQRRRIDWRKQRQRRPSLAPPPRLHPQLGVRCQRAGNRARRLRRRCPALQARDLGLPLPLQKICRRGRDD